MNINSKDASSYSEYPDTSFKYFQNISCQVETKATRMRASLKQIKLIDPKLQEEHYCQNGNSNWDQVSIERSNESK
jgi:hypothetical protein